MSLKKKHKLSKEDRKIAIALARMGIGAGVVAGGVAVIPISPIAGTALAGGGLLITSGIPFRRKKKKLRKIV